MWWGLEKLFPMASISFVSHIRLPHCHVWEPQKQDPKAGRYHLVDRKQQARDPRPPRGTNKGGHAHGLNEGMKGRRSCMLDFGSAFSKYLRVSG